MPDKAVKQSFEIETEIIVRIKWDNETDDEVLLKSRENYRKHLQNLANGMNKNFDEILINGVELYQMGISNKN